MRRKSQPTIVRHCDMSAAPSAKYGQADSTFTVNARGDSDMWTTCPEDAE